MEKKSNLIRFDAYFPEWNRPLATFCCLQLVVSDVAYHLLDLLAYFGILDLLFGELIVGFALAT